jgi:hypothetical protein
MGRLREWPSEVILEIIRAYYTKDWKLEICYE